jgi:signal transduction histidine kinase
MAIALARPMLDLTALHREGFLEHLFEIGAIASSATVGALITSRQRGNRIGLLFLTLAGAAAISVTTGTYVSLATERDLPLREASAWISSSAFVAMLGPLAFLFLLFPTGHVPTPRWRWLLRVMLVAYGLAVVTFALTPGVMESGFLDVHAGVRNPIAFPLIWRDAVQVVTQSAGLIVFAGALLSVVSLVLRFRRATAEERQQIRWLAYLAGFLSVWLVTFIALEATGVLPENADSLLGNIGFFVLIIGLFFGLPITCAIAILRYRLYELDVVVRKTVLYTVLAAMLLLVGVVVVWVATGLLASMIGDRLDLVAGVLIGVLIWPLRRLAAKVADRVVFGGRASPYEALTTFSHRVGETYSSDEVLERMAVILAETTRAAGATVWLRSGDEYVPVAGATDRLARVSAQGEDLPPLPGDHAAAVRHQGELLGALAVSMHLNDPLDGSRERLIDDLAAQAGVVLANVRLIQDLRESRRRLVTAQDEERRRIERNIHDGAQQQLVALNVKLGLARQLATRDAEATSRALESLQAETTAALDDLRDLARGIYPPLLADKGLVAALEAQARKAAVPVAVEADGVGRFPPEVEATVYFCALEALNNVAKYAGASRATVRLTDGAGELRFEVTDDGAGFEPAASNRGTGLQGMTDRLAALGGELTVRSSPGKGTTIVGWLPVEETRE